MLWFQIREIGCICDRTFGKIEGILAVEAGGVVLIDAAGYGEKREVVGGGWCRWGGCLDGKIVGRRYMDVDCAGDENVLENLVPDFGGKGEECQLRFC